MYHFILGSITFPITPEKVDIKIKGRNETIELMDGTEYSIIKQPGLSEISFSAMLPHQKYPFAIYYEKYENRTDFYQPPSWYLDALEGYVTQQTPTTFQVIKIDKDWNKVANESIYFPVTIEDYNITNDAANGRDIMVDISLKSYREPVVATYKVENGQFSAEKVRSTLGKTYPQVYTCTGDEYLWEICAKVLGDEKKAYDVAKNNGIFVGDKPEMGRRISLWGV